MLSAKQTKIQQLNLEHHPLQIYTHRSHPHLTYISQNQLHLYHMKQNHYLQQIQYFSKSVQNLCSHNKKIIYSSGRHLHLNDRKILTHTDTITKLQCDQFGLLLASSEDRTISLTSAERVEELGSLRGHMDGVTDMNWHRSLVISGDRVGQVYLWDINKTKLISQRKIHEEEVNFIHYYVDYVFHNLYFTASKREKRIVFSDLRTNKKIKIVNGLPIHNIHVTQSGKIFAIDEDNFQTIDIFSQFKAYKGQSTKNKKITCSSIMNQYLVLGYSNGVVNLYNSDLMEKQLSIDVVKDNKIKCLQIHNKQSIIVLVEDGRTFVVGFYPFSRMK